MTTGTSSALDGSIFAISPHRFIKSSPASPRQQSGHQARAFSHSLGQENPWFVISMYSRFGFGLVFAAGYLALAWNLLTLGRREATISIRPVVPAE